MIDALIVFLKTIWDKTQFWSLATGAVVGWYAQAVIEIIQGLLA